VTRHDQSEPIPQLLPADWDVPDEPEPDPEASARYMQEQIEIRFHGERDPLYIPGR